MFGSHPVATKARKQNHRNVKKRSFRRLLMEQLEDRRLLALVTWDGGGGDLIWSNPFNWSGDSLPMADDSVRIDATIENRPVIVTSNVTISSLTAHAPLTVQNGVFNIGLSSIITDTLLLTGGTLTGSGDLTVSGTLDWSSGMMEGTGKTIIPAGGELNVIGTLSKWLNRTLDNAGTALYGGTQFRFGLNSSGPGIFNNLVGATFTVVGEGDFSVNGAHPHAFNNAGTFVKQGDGTTTTVDTLITFNNTGNIRIDEGTLDLRGGGISTGDFNIADRAILVFSAGTHTLQPGTTLSVTGGGITRVSGGTVSALDVLEIPTLSLSGGTLILGVNHTVDTLLLTGGTLAGSGDLTVSGTLDWSSGMMEGTGKTIIPAGGELNVSGTSSKWLNRTLDNAGTALYGGTQFRFGLNSSGPGIFNNLVGATFTVVGEGDFSQSGAHPHAFNNAGTFIKQGDGTTTTVDTLITFNNTGNIRIDEGTLDLRGGGISTGDFNIADRAILVFSAGTHTLQPGTTLSVTGGGITRVSGGTVTALDVLEIPTLSLSGGTLILGVNHTVDTLLLTGGTLAGSGDLTVSGTLDWSSGMMEGTGKTIIPPGGELNVIGTLSKWLNRTLDNAGTALYGGTQFRFGLNSSGPGIFNNLVGATFTVIGEGDFSQSGGHPHAFNNAGTFIKQGEGTTTTVGTRISFNNTGNVRIDEGTFSPNQDLTFVGVGTLYIEGDATLLLNGNLVGSTVAASSFDSRGHIRFQGGGTRLLEVMSRNVGNSPDGFVRNFAYGTLELAQGTNLQLIDSANNSIGSTAEALYVDTLIVPAGSTIDLNGYNVYVRNIQVAGAVVNGQLIPLSDNVTKLTLGEPFQGNIQSREWRYFKVDFSQGDPLFIRLAGLPMDGTVELLVGRDAAPSRTTFDEASRVPFAGEQFINLPEHFEAGTYYILVHAPTLVSSPTTFELTAWVPGLTVLNNSFGTAGNAGDFTLRAFGARLDRTVTAKLTNDQGFELAAKSHFVEDTTKFHATFDLRSVAPGTYDVVFSNTSGNEVVVRQSLTVVMAERTGVEALVLLPSAIRFGTITTAQVEYRNNSLNDLPVPLLTMIAENGTISLTRNPENFRETIRLLALPEAGQVDVLRPGEKVVQTFYVRSTNAGKMSVGVNVLEPGEPSWDEPADWSPLIPTAWEMQEDPAVWEQLLDDVSQRMGRSNGEYVQNLTQIADVYATWEGQRITDADYLTQLLLTSAVVPQNASSGEDVCSSQQSHPTHVYALDQSNLNWRPTPLQATDVNANADTVVIIHGNANSLESDWITEMALALWGQRVTNILSLDWGDIACLGVLGFGADPIGTATHIPSVAEMAFQELRLSGLRPENMHLIGHSHGAHVAGLIGERFRRQGLGNVSRITALDASEESVHIHSPRSTTKNENYFGTGWGANRGSADFIDFYKSSEIMGGESNWGHDNFLLVENGDTWGDTFLGDFPNAANHGFAIDWYKETIHRSNDHPLNPHNLGYGWTKTSWENLQAEIPGTNKPNDGPWKGLIRGGIDTDHVIELISQAIYDTNDSQDGSGPIPKYDEWNYPGAWPGGHSDNSAIEAMIDSIASSLELEIMADSVKVDGSAVHTTEPLILSAASNIMIGYDLQNNADNRSISRSTRLRSLGQHAVYPKTDVKYWLSRNDTLDKNSGTDIRLSSDTYPFVGALNEGDSRKSVANRVTLPSADDIRNKLGGGPSGLFYVIIDVASDYKYELYPMNNIYAFPASIEGGDLAANPGGPYSVIDADCDGGETVTLDGSRSAPADNIVSYTWMLGDEVIGSQSVVTHLFPQGLHNASLTVTDRDGNSDTASATVQVKTARCTPPPREPKATTNVIRSWDPNDIIGPAGYGPDNHIVATSVMPYMIRFENDPEEATAPAAMVTITQTLDDDLDWTSFRLGNVGFGSLVVNVPANSAFFETRYDATATLGVLVDITAGIDVATGEIRWEFVAVDPATGQLPENPFVGFLPPNNNSPEGEGFVTYTIRPKAGVITGTRVDAEASIVFDVNEAILTPPIFNTFDVGLPRSGVLPLPAQTAQNPFTVRWSGVDDASGEPGSGIARFDIYVSINDGPFVAWLTNTPDLSALYAGEAGKKYAFYSIAGDNVGYREQKAALAEATTRVVVGSPWQNVNNRYDVNGDSQVTPLDALIIINYLNRDESGEPSQNQSPYLDVNGDRLISAIDALAVINLLNQRGSSGEGESLEPNPGFPLAGFSAANDSAESRAFFDLRVETMGYAGEKQYSVGSDRKHYLRTGRNDWAFNRMTTDGESEENMVTDEWSSSVDPVWDALGLSFEQIKEVGSLL